jgi:PKD repeat protein
LPFLSRPTGRHPSPTATRRSRRARSRGQSLAEFALVVPLLLFLTVIALDFGRIYLGWVNLQSMTRIAANLAANNPTAWSGAGNPAVKATYQAQIKNDATATNCQLPLIGGVRTAPAPTFSGTNVGDTATVSMSCTFEVITPGISSIIGKSVTVSSSAAFPVKQGMTSPGGAGTGVPPNAAFLGNGTQAPNPLVGTAPFTVVFRDTSGGDPTSWAWDFADGATSIAQDPLDHTFATPGTYVVSMTASNAWGSSTQTMGVTVTAASLVDFTATPSSGAVPLVVAFADASTSGGTAYAWDFGAGQGTATGTTASHTYNAAGTYTVTLTVTYPTQTLSATKTITVDPGLCTVPSLNGVKRNDAQAKWFAAKFTGLVSDGPGAPNGNYTITSQTLTALSIIPCDSNIKVNNP